MKRIRKIAVLALASVLSVCLGGVCLNYAELTASASEYVLDTFTIEETASVRNTQPNGIRFTTRVDGTTKSKAAELENDGYTVTYGALLCPTKYINGDLTFETLEDKYECDIETKKWQDEDKTTYTSVLVGNKNADGTYTDFLSALYNTPISARGYMKAVKGNETQYFYTVNTAERSLGAVAAMAIANGETSDLLTKMAENVRYDLEAVTLTTATSEGTVLYNALASSQKATVTLDGIVADLSGVVYSVGDSAIATLTDGVLTAQKVGETTLTASYNGQTWTTTLTVTDDFVAKSDYTILLPKNATDNENAAAKTLQNVFAKAGATIPVLTETGNETTYGKYISVGATKLSDAFVTLSVTKSTASEVSSVNNTVFVQGVTDKGTLYGVQQWLGTVLDYDYFLKDTYSVSTKAVALPSEILSYVPDIEHNVIDRNGDVRAEYGLEGYAEDVILVKNSLHNSTLILDPDTYASTNSKWYAAKYYFGSTLIKNSDGKAAELCYTARGDSTQRSAMAQAVAETIVNEFAKKTSSHKASFAVMDGNYQCKCSSCQNAGNFSDTFVPFLNEVCEKIEALLKEKGDARADTFKIVTLAYHQTNAAPENIKTLDNYSSFADHVELWFGDSYGDYTGGLKDSDNTKNQEIYENFEAWTNLLGADTDTLLWVYYTNTKNGFVPYNTFTAIRENYAMAKEKGVDYLFNQTIQAKSGWTMLKHYLISQLAWNATPDDDTWNGWIDKYFANAYGKGATAMRKWFDEWLALDTSAYETKTNDPAIHRNMETTANFPQDRMQQWINYAIEAEEALDKNDPNYQTYFYNILLEKLSPEYFLISLYQQTQYVNQFNAAVKIWDITNLGETEKIDATLTKFTALLAESSLAVNIPAESSYFNFAGSSFALPDNEYTFTVTGKEARFDKFYVYVNGNLMTSDDGTYTIENVTEALTIKVVHPYIEHESNVTVTYNTDGSIKFEKIVQTDSSNSKGRISADYINYMIGQGYTTLSMTITISDVNKANQALVTGGGINLSLYNKDDTYTTSQKIGTVTLPAEVTGDLEFWLQKDGYSWKVEEGGYMTITDFAFSKADGTTESLMPTAVSITAPAESSYYTFNGASSVEKESDYTFTITSKVSGCNDFVVFVNDEVIFGDNGTYTVKNVTEALTIKVLHGYIECESNVTVTYNADGSIKFEKIVASGSSNNNGWISKDYINYMIGKGYKYLGLTVQLSDIEKVNQGCIKLNENWFAFASTATAISVRKEIAEATTDLTFWLQKDGSGWKVQEGGYMTITDLYFAKELVNVTAPGTSSYYTFNGATSAAKGGVYTFTIENTVALCDRFIVFVNDEEVTGNNGTYVVKNVTEALTIKVLHGYIEHGANVTVTYNEDGSIIVKNAAYAYSIGTNNEAWGAWISADYVNYMMSQGYNEVQAYMQADFEIAAEGIMYSGSENRVRNINNYTGIAEMPLVTDSPVYFIVADANNSGNNIKGKGGYITITGLEFVK